MPGTTFKFEAIGTHWQIDIYDEINIEQQNLLYNEIQERIEIFSKNYSRFRPDSLVTQMSKQAGVYQLPDDAEPLFDTYRLLYQLTGGAFTPIIGSVMVEAGYDTDYSLVPTELHQPATWEDAIDYSFPKLTLKKPVLFDFGAAGKGYLIDIVSKIIEKNGINSFCVDAGGDILHKHANNEKLRVGLENPQNTTQAIGVAELSNKSICGSAGNRRAWANFHHIIDPRILASPKDILATWVVADNTLIADAIATCLFLVPSKILKSKFNFEYVILFQNYSAEISPAFPGELFTSQL